MTDINLNKCLVTKNHFGYDEYYNICTHEVQDVVPWVASDYFGFSVVLLCVVFILAAFGFLGYIAHDMSK